MASETEHVATDVRRVVHELNNLLAVLHGHAEALSRTMEDSDPRRRHIAGLFDVLTRSSASVRSLAVLFNGDTHASPGAVDSPGSLRGTETVLFVEDETALRSITSRFIAMNGYKVLEADGAEEALRLFKDEKEAVDILVTDLTMQGMDGVELSRILSARRPKMKVLFLSGHGADEMRRRVGEGPDLHILPKPFRPREFVQKLRAILDGPSPRAE